MEARRLQQSPYERPSNTLNHRLIVRMGGKEFVIGEDEEPAGPTQKAAQNVTQNEKLISLSMMSSRMSSRPVERHSARAKWRKWFYNWWTQFHRFIVESLDKLLQQSHGELTTHSSHYPTGSNQRMQHEKNCIDGAQHGRNRFKDGLTFGTIVGLMLGCIGLVLFHLITPRQSAGTAVRVSVSATSPSALVAQTGTGFTVPAVRIYATQVGSFRTVADARLAQRRLLARGVPTSRFVEKPIRLVTQAAMDSRHLKSEEERLHKLGIPFVITTFNWPAANVQTFSSVSMDSMNRISHWLSAEVSALNALVGVLSDGVPKRDAIVARDNAAKLVPSDETLRATGHGESLVAVKADFNDAFKSYAAGNAQKAMLKALDAYAEMQSLVEHPELASNSSSSP